MALADVEYFLIRATYNQEMISTRIRDISLDIAGQFCICPIAKHKNGPIIPQSM